MILQLGGGGPGMKSSSANPFKDISLNTSVQFGKRLYSLYNENMTLRKISMASWEGTFFILEGRVA